MTLARALLIVVFLSLLSFITAAVPFALGSVLGFAAFVATPVLMPLLLTAGGAFIAWIVPAEKWVGVAAGATVMATFYGLLLAVGALGSPLWTLLLRIPFLALGPFLVALPFSAAFLSLGAWLLGLRSTKSR